MTAPTSSSSSTSSSTTFPFLSASSLSDMSNAVMNLLNAQMKFGSDLLQSMTGTSVPSMTSQMQKMTKKMSAPCCTIPAPCWMPQPLGDCTSHVAQCRTACIDIVVTNCDRVAHPLTVTVAGAAASDVTVTPASTNVAPYMRTKVTVCFTVPTDAKNGDQFEMVIMVAGCKDYYLRWTVSVGTIGLDSRHQIDVDDCPDLIHHWYDHFYCQRGCRSRSNQPGSTGFIANG